MWHGYRSKGVSNNNNEYINASNVGHFVNSYVLTEISKLRPKMLMHCAIITQFLWELVHNGIEGFLFRIQIVVARNQLRKCSWLQHNMYEMPGVSFAINHLWPMISHFAYCVHSLTGCTMCCCTTISGQGWKGKTALQHNWDILSWINSKRQSPQFDCRKWLLMTLSTNIIIVFKLRLYVSKLSGLKISTASHLPSEACTRTVANVPNHFALNKKFNWCTGWFRRSTECDWIKNKVKSLTTNVIQLTVMSK